MQSSRPNGRAGDAAESDIDTMFDEILGGFGDSDLSLNDPRSRAHGPRRGHQQDDSIVSLISSYEGDPDDRDPPRPTNAYSSQRLRPLPQVPGASPRPPFTAPAPPPPLPMAMPSPEPFQHPPGAYVNSYISPGPANALLNAHPRRQLPSQPDAFSATSGNIAQRQARRPTTAGSDSVVGPQPGQPSPRLSHPNPSPYTIPTVQVGGPDDYQPSFPRGPPPGAMLPAIPGALSSPNLSSPTSFAPSPQPNHDAYSPGAPYVPPGASNPYPGHPPRTTSRMPANDFYPSPVSATLSPSPGATLGRSSSASSSIFSGGRDIRGPAPPSTADTSYFPPSVDRANSKSSNWSSNSTMQPGAGKYTTSTASYDSTLGGDAAGYLDLPSSSPVADTGYRADQQYLEERIATAKGRLELHEDDQDDYDYSDEDETLFVNLALLSHLAVKLRDKVPRGTHVKGSIPYTHAFTGKDIVVRSSFILPLTYNSILGRSRLFNQRSSANSQSHSI